MSVVALTAMCIVLATGAAVLYPSPADRLGFSAARGPVTNYDVAPLRAGCYYDWSPGANPPHPAGLAFAHLIRVSNINWPATKAAVAQATQNDPGALWLIGNEPDRRVPRTAACQRNTTPSTMI